MYGLTFFNRSCFLLMIERRTSLRTAFFLVRKGIRLLPKILPIMLSNVGIWGLAVRDRQMLEDAVGEAGTGVAGWFTVRDDSSDCPQFVRFFDWLDGMVILFIGIIWIFEVDFFCCNQIWFWVKILRLILGSNLGKKHWFHVCLTFVTNTWMSMDLREISFTWFRFSLCEIAYFLLLGSVTEMRWISFNEWYVNRYLQRRVSIFRIVWIVWRQVITKGFCWKHAGERYACVSGYHMCWFFLYMCANNFARFKL